MKTSNIQQGRAHPEAIIRGWVSGKRAGSTGITVGDGSTSGDGITNITVTGGGGTVTITPDGTAVIDIPGGGASGTPAWFNVKDYGAVGDGVTDDTTAINDAIAALITAGVGVLYFPGATYLVSGALTSLTVPCMVLGDGGAFENPLTEIVQTSSTAHTFTQAAHGVTFRGIKGTRSGTTSTAGSFIRVTVGNRGFYEDLSADGFWINVDFDDGAEWTMYGCLWSDGVKYNLRYRHIDLPDGGDWTIASCLFGNTVGADAHIRYESGGGGKILGCKFNGATTVPVLGLDIAVTTGTNTSVLAIVGNSFENMSSHAIKVVKTGSGAFNLLTITGNQFGLYSNNSGRCVYLSAITGVVIDGCVMTTDGTARAAIELVSTDRVTLGDLQLVGNFTSRYTSSGDTNTTDGGGGGTSDHGALTGLSDDDHPQYVLETLIDAKGDLLPGSAADTAARLAVGSNDQVLTADSSQSTGMKWATPAAASAQHILLADGRSTPFTFNDLLQMDDGSDFLWTDP